MTPGLFGPIAVADRNGARGLYLNGQLQGGSFLAPDAEIVSPGRQGPGPVSSSVYTLGWLAAGAHRPAAKALMIGLGSGAGAVAYLFCFPGARLDVVEIDPAMVDVALASFPLLSHYVELGRLRILCGDAAEFVANLGPGVYDVAMHDAYTGDPCLTISSPAFYAKLRESCGDLWLNVIGRPWQSPMRDDLNALAAAGCPPQLLIFADHSVMSPFGDCIDKDSNWIVTTADVSPEILDAFEPYDALHAIEHPSAGAVQAVDFARTSWEECLRRCVCGAEITELLSGLDG
jgi:hypothetical protein